MDRFSFSEVGYVLFVLVNSHIINENLKRKWHSKFVAHVQKEKANHSYTCLHLLHPKVLILNIFSKNKWSNDNIIVEEKVKLSLRVWFWEGTMKKYCIFIDNMP